MSGSGSSESAESKKHPGELNPKIREILACPKCHGGLEDSWGPEGYVCKACGLLYPVDDGMANFIVDEAKPWQEK